MHHTTGRWRIKLNTQESQSTMVSRWLNQVPEKESPSSRQLEQQEEAERRVLDKRKVQPKVWRLILRLMIGRMTSHELI
jgi:hypothetical protein